MSSRHATIILILWALFSLLGGCRCSQEEPPGPEKTESKEVASAQPDSSAAPPAPEDGRGDPHSPPPVPLLAESMQPLLFELPVQALIEWRRHRGRTLVLLSQDPFLQPVPSAMHEKTERLVLQDSDEAIYEETDIASPSPVLQPLMALSAALRSGLFPEVVWLLPAEVPAEELDLVQFRQQLSELGAVTEKEAASFEKGGLGLFVGRVRGVPLHVVHPSSLPALDRPVLLHLDLSYFAPLYKGEIKTPLYKTLGRLLGTLRDTGWMASGVTISLGHRNGILPLQTRFLGPDLAGVFTSPERLDQPMPPLWELRSRALYLDNFMRTEEIHALYQEALTIAPEDPAVHFALYDIQRQLKLVDDALASLARAVERDPVYGMEYLKLVPVALEKGNPDGALRMLDQAAAVFPDDPFIRLRKATLLVELHRAAEARELVQGLLQLPWSDVYYPEIPEYLRTLRSRIDPGE